MAVFSLKSIHQLRWVGGMALAVVTALASVEAAKAQSIDPASQAPPPEQSEELNQLRPLNQSSTAFTISAGEQLVAEASEAISEQDYSAAAQKLQTARTTFNQLSNYYSDLAGLFLGVNTQINQSHRQNALKTAQLRDEASYQLALVYRSQNRPDLAVPLLIEILNSQQPTRDLGQRAYQQLFELGFVDEPYSIGGS